jgi:hypothetical protein
MLELRTTSTVAGLVTIAACAALLVVPNRSWAAYTAGAVVDNACDFQRDFEWTFPVAGVDNSPGGIGGGAGANWIIASLTSPAPAGGPTTIRNLTVVARHQSGTAPCDPLHGANPAGGTMTFPNVARPPIGSEVRSAAVRIEHGDHADYFGTAIQVPETGNLKIRVKGRHGEVRLTKASVHNETGKRLTLTIFPSYRQADGTTTEGAGIEVGAVGKNSHKEIDLPREPGTGNAPTNYRVVAFGSARSDTTLAFLGEVSGISRVTELELAPMIQLFGTRSVTGRSEILAPMLRDPGEVVDLYAFVDLTQWVASRASFSPLQRFSLSAGTSDDLPGYFVSTTPITLDAEGSPSGTAFTGEVYASITIDGAVAPATETCRFGAQPAATLLYPYFETDLGNPLGPTTLISVNNAAAECTLVRVTLWTDLAVPTLTFYLYLSPADVQTLNLRDVFNGVLPKASDALTHSACQGAAPPPCDPTDLDYAPGPSEVAALRAAHTGAPDPVDGGCAGVDSGDDVAVGYITVDAAPQCSLPPTVASSAGYLEALVDPTRPFFAMTNSLWGDYFYVDNGGNFAQSEPAVSILADPQRFSPGDYTFYGRFNGFDASDGRAPLSSSWATRFLSGGDFDGGTHLIVWRDPRSPAVQPVPCGTLPAWAPLGQASVAGWDEDENPFAVPEELTFPWATQRLSISDRVPVPFGWLHLDLSHSPSVPAQAWVTAEMSALGRFSVAHTGVRLNDLCGVQAAPEAVEVP